MKTRYRNMTPDRAETVRALRRLRFKQRTIARLLGISQGTVSRIISGQVWA